MNRLSRIDHLSLLPYLLLLVLAGFLYWNMAAGLINSWNTLDEFSHGYFLPLIAGYMLWEKRALFIGVDQFRPSWLGVLISVIAIMVFIIGAIGLTPYLEKVSFLLLLYGIFVATFGFRITPIVFIPFTLIFMSFPLPVLVNSALTAEMQLISSKLGVVVIRAFDIPVYLEGNVIDIGVFQLQVVEACSGLRYMYPLLSLSLILAYLFKVAIWKRVVIFLSAIPITIFMNSFRIGMIGVLVEYKGIGMAQGFLHDFEGWIIFVACLFVLVVEMWLITFSERKSQPFSSLIERF